MADASSNHGQSTYTLEQIRRATEIVGAFGLQSYEYGAGETLSGPSPTDCVIKVLAAIEGIDPA